MGFRSRVWGGEGLGVSRAWETLNPLRVQGLSLRTQSL